MDIWNKNKRSEVMSKIRSKDTKPERILRSRLFKLGYRFRLNKKGLPGKPDIVLPKYKVVIFVHGCFWHYHQLCPEGRIPSTNTPFWQAKLTKNTDRDERNVKALTDIGWDVIVVWECELKNELKISQKIKQITSRLKR